MKKGIVSLLCGVLLLSACTRSTIHTLSKDTGSLKLKQAAVLNTTLVDHINDLTFAIQDEKATDNVFSSGVSIYLALAMTAHGAAGETYKQFIDLLAPGMTDQKAWLEELRALQGNLNAATPTKIGLANSIWMRDTFAPDVKETFLTRNSDYFGAMIAAQNFDDPQTVADINDWVRKNTNKLIDKAVETIDPLTVMFLINTIYFKAEWQDKFDANDTSNGVFHGKSDVNVKFMNRVGNYPYYETDAYQSVLLPYNDGNTGMIVVLGKNATAPIDSTEAFANLLKGFEVKNVGLHMPRVNIDTKEILNDKLIALGLKDAFSDTIANFIGISDKHFLYIDEVLHKAKLIIDEKGTEAAAMTVVTIKTTSAQLGDVEMKVDRPYQIFIVDLKNKLILFNGIIQKVSN
jgi:serine protease inhibitor